MGQTASAPPPRWEDVLIIMRVFVIFAWAGLTVGSLVKREATAEAEAEADPSGYRRHGGYHSEPVCTLTPVKECVPRQVETPRKVCQHVYDLYEDTVVTENCEEVVTTTCVQSSQQVHHSSAVIDSSSRLVEEGLPKPIAHAPAHAGHAHAPGARHHGYPRREAEAAPEAEAEANPMADPYYGHGYGRAIHGGYKAHHGYKSHHGYKAHHGYNGHPAPVVVAPAPVHPVAAPVCESVPAKQCEKVPVSTPRKVPSTVSRPAPSTGVTPLWSATRPRLSPTQWRSPTMEQATMDRCSLRSADGHFN